MKLTDAQTLALETNRHVVVEAGAGSGKTTVLVRRFLKILELYPDITADRILTITYTKKAAGELVDRIQHAIQEYPIYSLDDQAKIERWKHHFSMAEVGTIHSFCSRLLKTWGHWIGVDPGIRIIEDWEIHYIWESVVVKLLDVGIQSSDPLIVTILGFRDAPTVCKMLNQLFQSGRELEPQLQSLNDDLSQALLGIFRRSLLAYRQALDRYNAIDFSELQHRSLKLLSEYPSVARAVARDYPFILVDEFQDTDSLQWSIIDQISGFSTHENRCNVYLVGDVKQAIYSFRGTDTRLFQQVLDEFSTRPDATVVRLADNFRSAPQLINFYNGLFSELFQRDTSAPITYVPLQPGRGIDSDDHAVELAFADSKETEPALIASWLTQHHTNGVPWENMAIISRRNVTLNTFAEAMTRWGIPISRPETTYPLRNDWSQALIALIRWLANDNAPRRYELNQWNWADLVTDLDLNNLRTDATRNGYYSTLVTIVQNFKSDAVLDAWAIIDPILKTTPSLPDAVELIDHELNHRGPESREIHGAGVRLLTIHASKGLEFDCVALGGCGSELVRRTTESVIVGPDGEIGISDLDSRRKEFRETITQRRKQRDIDEEKRTFYVGCTRAKNHLLISGYRPEDTPLSHPPKTYFDLLLGHASVYSNSVVFRFNEGEETVIFRHSMTVPKVEHPIEPVPIVTPSHSAGNRMSPVTASRSHWISVSRLIDRLIDPSTSTHALPRINDSSGHRGSTIGSAVHAGIERYLSDQNLSAHEAISRSLESEDTGSHPNIRHHLTTSFNSEFFNDLRRTPSLSVEYDFLTHIHPFIISGRIDCIRYDNNQWTITDFKTDRTDDSAIDRHRIQLAIYSIALASAKRTEAPIGLELFFTRSGSIHRWTITATERAEWVKRIATV